MRRVRLGMSWKKDPGWELGKLDETVFDFCFVLFGKLENKNKTSNTGHGQQVDPSVKRKN